MNLVEAMKYAHIPLALNGKAGEEVMILTDSRTDPLIGQALAAAAFEMGMEPTLMTIVARAAHGHEPPKGAAEAMKGVFLLICATSTAMTHTDAVRGALRQGVKYISMPSITLDMLCNGAATADYQEVDRITATVADILNRGSKVRVTSPQGTDLVLSIAQRPCFPLSGIVHPGTIAGFPDGEAAIAPVEGTTEGTLVFDQTMHTMGLLTEPIAFTVSKGRVVEVRGGAQAKALEELWQRHGDDNSRQIGEFAVGTNPKARISGNATEDKKRAGTIHIGLGDNSTLAGKVVSATHLDGVLSQPTVWVDGHLLVDGGKLKV
ncbi:MAG: aminopeptidase [Chloroflexi bacterium]|nr:aminopeptidase [Chloroflexota bacterium]